MMPTTIALHLHVNDIRKTKRNGKNCLVVFGWSYDRYGEGILISITAYTLTAISQLSQLLKEKNNDIVIKGEILYGTPRVPKIYEIMGIEDSYFLNIELYEILQPQMIALT